MKVIFIQGFDNAALKFTCFLRFLYFPEIAAGITAEAIWVGVGAEPEFLGRDVRGKAVVIYSTFVPGARHYSALPKKNRPRTMVFIQFPDHHHGEVARGRKEVGIDATYPWNKVALKLTMEHPSETLLYMYNSGLTATNQLSASRWSALGSPEFKRMAFEQLRDFGVTVYGVEDGPKNGNYAPSFHIINHVIYHTSLDTPELVPAEGMNRVIRSFAAIIDRVNKMKMDQIRGPNFPPKAGENPN